MNKAAFLDRDGVINRKAEEGAYITRWDDMEFLDHVPEAIALLNRAGFRVIVASNQRCVAKGLITVRELDAIHRQMCEALARAGAVIEAVYYCPHESQSACGCRKPAPGMLLDAARAHNIDLSASWMIGDSEIDVEAGKNAGCKTARLCSTSEERSCGANVVSSSLLEVIRQIVNPPQHSESSLQLSSD
jgi:D-glycero-D-manno-heptose 1,7-bisphosphate phosphatase